MELEPTNVSDKITYKNVAHARIFIDGKEIDPPLPFILELEEGEFNYSWGLFIKNPCSYLTSATSQSHVKKIEISLQILTEPVNEKNEIQK